LEIGVGGKKIPHTHTHTHGILTESRLAACERCD